MMRIISLIVACWAILLSVPAKAQSDDWAAPLKEAIDLQSSGEYKSAYALMLPHAQADNGLAQFNLALHHELGWSRQRDEHKACHWYQRAAYNNMPLAMQKYADCLVPPARISDTEDTALVWYQKAFQHGIYESGCAAGRLLIKDKDSSKSNLEEGLRLCRTSAEKGSISAALYLGELYYEGELVEENVVLALKLFQLSSPEKQPVAAFYIATMFDEGVGVQQDVKQATYWYEIAASQGFDDAYLPLAALYWTLYQTSHQEKARFLAKSYLWVNTSSALETSVDDVQHEALLSQISNETPHQWKKELNAIVAQHIQTFHVASAVSL
jgi:TPR repeat protein